MQTIGQKIRKLRESKGLSQRDLAKLAGISPNSRSNISQVESGAISPSYVLLSGIAQALGFDSPAKFFEDVDTWQSSIPEVSEVDLLRQEVAELKRLLHNRNQ